MENAIQNFASQFLFSPIVENKEKLKKNSSYIVSGMGGSNLAPGLIKMRLPEKDMISHRDYGLPAVSKDVVLRSRIIASSYSGNTEETVDSFKVALRENLDTAVIASGGELLALAEENAVPYVRIPDTGIQPRSALGYSIRALLALMDEENLLDETAKAVATLSSEIQKSEGKALAERVAGRVPIIYASTYNFPIAYNWKIKYNETGKIPAFCNALPELNHNEMTGFDVVEKTASLSDCFYFLFLTDTDDNPKISRRMDILYDLYAKRGLRGEKIQIAQENTWLKIFSSLMLADWAAFFNALHYNLDPEQVPMIEEFKKKIA